MKNEPHDLVVSRLLRAPRHEELGFFDGWNTCITPLENLAQRLP
jgi:hypothetical protein